MSDKRKIRVGITQGDINGIGYEVILKTFATPEMFEICTPIVYGSPKAAAYHRKALEMDVAYNAIATLNEAEDGKLNIINCNGDEIRIELGNATKEAGQAAFEALERAVQDYKEGKVDVLVTAPINKSTIQNEEFHFPAHRISARVQRRGLQIAYVAMQRRNSRCSGHIAPAPARCSRSHHARDVRGETHNSQPQPHRGFRH